MDSMLILKWVSTTYILNNQLLIKREGIINIIEKIYDLKTIRSISIKQGLIGKLFNFGDLTIKTSASGGYQEEIYIMGITNPAKYKANLQLCIDYNIENIETINKYPRKISQNNTVFKH